MTRSREFLGVVAAIWLSCQLGTVVLTPIALWVNAADEHALACTCAHGGDGTCPMHHKSAPAGSKICVIQNATNQATVLLTSLFSVAGLVPDSTAVAESMPSTVITVGDHPSTTARPIPPDPPPPRA